MAPGGASDVAAVGGGHRGHDNRGVGEQRASQHYNAGYEDRYGTVLEGSLPEDAGRSTEHPWHEWTDGRARVLKRGKHFHAGTTKGMRSTIYAHARHKANTAVKVKLGRPEQLPDGSYTGKYVEAHKFLSVQFFPGRPYAGGSRGGARAAPPA